MTIDDHKSILPDTPPPKPAEPPEPYGFRPPLDLARLWVNVLWIMKRLRESPLQKKEEPK